MAGAATPSAGTKTDAADVLDEWLQRQADIRTWSADFVQTRSLKTLVQPLTTRGHVLFETPDRFRWEIGDPPETVAVRESNTVLILYPPLRRAERYSLDAASAGPWRPMLTLMEAGFPSSRQNLESRFRLLEHAISPKGYELTLEPRSAAARRVLTRFHLLLSTPGLELLQTEMEFADGSRLRNDFTHISVNAPVDEGVFSPHLGPDYTVTEPLAPEHR